MFLYAREAVVTRPRLKHDKKTSWRRTILVIADPKLQTKQQYLDSVMDYYKQVILPEILAIESSILNGSEPDVYENEPMRVVELPPGYRWAPVPLPPYSSWPKAVDPECVYRYLLAQDKPRTKPEIGQALGLQDLRQMERAFAWLREQAVVVPCGVYRPDNSKLTYNLYEIRKIIVDQDGAEVGAKDIVEDVLPIEEFAPVLA